MIEVKNLSKKYGNYLAVDDVSFSVNRGEIVGFLGPNGAGKSTIMNIITGYLSLTEGSVTIDGFDITKDPEKAKRRIGYLPEIPPLYTEMKVKEFLGFIYDLKKVKFQKAPHIDEVMSVVGIKEVKNRLIKNLSKGYRQRVGFAQALIGNPDVLILDEPTVGLDPKQIIEIRSLIKKLGVNHTVIISSHILSEIQAVCENVIIINKGRLVASGNINELSSRLAGGGRLILRAEGLEERLLEALSAAADIADIKALGEKEPGVFEFAAEPKEGQDIRGLLFDLVTENEGRVLELYKDSITLEQIFLKLTENADNADALKILEDKTKKEEE